MRDVIIIGAGPAGMTAAIYAKRANLDVLLLDKLAPGGQVVNTFEVENYPALGKINGAELAIKMYEHVCELGIPFEYATASKISGEFGHFTVETEEGMTFESQAIIIAVGTKPNCLHCSGESQYAGVSISWCAICDGAKYRDKDVIVVGGGNSAVEESIYLSEIAKSVTIVTMLDLTADPIACDRLRSKPNVKIYEWYDIKEFFGTEEQLQGLRAVNSKTGEKLEVTADGVFEYIGLSPVTEFVRDLGITNSYGYLECDARMETKIRGIYGAGDSNSKALRQIVTATNDGAIAAVNVAAELRK